MQGLEKFKEYMSGFRSHYVVIGGLATVLTLEDRAFPAQIELFSKVPEYVEVLEDVHIVHIPMEGYTSSFSAIIMDEAYYDFAIEHSEIVGDIRILKPEALIVLKAVAYNENLRRKEAGANVDQRDIDKHKKDVYRLAYVFDGSERFEVNETIKAQMKAFISEVEKSPIDGKNMFRGKGIPAMGTEEFTELLRGMFGV